MTTTLTSAPHHADTTTAKAPAPDSDLPAITTTSARLHMLGHRVNRVFTWALLVVLVLTVANMISEFILPPAGHAVPGIPDITAICDPNYQLPEPGNPTVTMEGDYNRDGPQELWVTPSEGSYTGSESHGAAYGTGGLTWHTYGTSLCQPLDYTVNITTLLAGVVLSALVASASLMGFIMQAAFTTNIVDAVLTQPDLSNTITDVNTSLWESWFPLIIGGAVLVMGYLVARSRIQEAGSRFLWTVIATALIAGIALSPSALSNVGKTVNQFARDASVTSMAAVNGGSSGCATMDSTEESEADSSAMSSDAEQMITCMSTNMANDFVYPVWSVGAAGVRADESAPIVSDQDGTTNGAGPDVWIHWNTEGDEVGDDVKYAATQLPPEGVVPTRNADGVPTTAEYLRWTQSYTAAEAQALEDNSNLRCEQTGSPSLEDLGKMASLDDGQTSDDLCVKKWAARAGILYGLKSSDPSAYAAATGKDDLNSRISPAVMSMPISSAAQLAMMGVAFMMFFYQLEFLVYFFLVVIFLMASIVKGPRLMTSWLGWTGATMIKRIGLGIMFGFTLLLFGWIQDGLINISLDGWGALLLVFTSTVSNLILLGGLLALIIVWFKIKPLLLQQTRLDQYGTSKPVEAAKGVFGKAMSIGAGGVTGGLTGGAAGAAVGAATTAVSRGNVNLTSAMRKGASAGTALTTSKLTREQAQATLSSSQTEVARHEQEGYVHHQKAESGFLAATTAENEGNTLSAQAAQVESQATAKDADVDQGVRQYVTTSTPTGQAAANELTTAQIGRATAESDLQTATTARADFAHKHDLTHMHELDPNGNLVITDLATGDTTTTADTSQYRADLAPSQIFTSQTMQNDYTTLVMDQLTAQSDLADAEIKESAAEGDLDRIVRDQRNYIGQMSNSEIDSTFKDNPALAQQARAWKASQLQAQRLHQQAESLNQQSAQRMETAARERETAQREQSMAQSSDSHADSSRTKADSAQRTLESKTAGKAAAAQLLHSAGGRSRRR